MNAEANIKIILIGNKIDLEEKRDISEQEGKELANEFGVLFAWVSAKNGLGVKRAFLDLMESIRSFEGESDSESLKIKIEKEEEVQGLGCC